MKILGYIVVIKRSGADGTPFPLTNTSCSIGRNNECDIRVQLPSVSRQHCRVDVEPSGKAYITNLSQTNPTLLNDTPLAGEEISILTHKDLLTVADRQFRWEYPEGSILATVTKRERDIDYKILSPKAKSPVSQHMREGYRLETSGAESNKKRKPGETELPDAKRKRVSFGPYLNPEHFDKQLPPATPVSKGEKPNTRRASLDLSSSPFVKGSSKKKNRVSLIPSASVITEESGIDTPTKSLLRRRSPTPVKPYLARSLGLLTPKALNGTPNSSPENLKTHSVQAELSASEVSSALESAFQKSTKAVGSLSPKVSSDDEGNALSVKSPKASSPTAASPKTKGPAAATPKAKSPSASPKAKSPSASPKAKSPKVSPKAKSPKVISTKISSPKMSPKSTKSPKAVTPKKSSFQTASPKKLEKTPIEKIPIKLVTPKSGAKKLSSPKTISAKMTTPKTSPKTQGTPKNSNLKTSPKKSATLKISPGKLGAPKTTPKKLGTPKTTPKKLGTPKTTPKKVDTPKVTPKKVDTPKVTPKKVDTPKVTPKKVDTPRVTPKKVDTPKVTPKKVDIPKVTPKKVETPKVTPKKVDTPKVAPQNVDTPKVTPKQVDTPKVMPKKVDTPKVTPKKVDTPKVMPKKVDTPKVTPKKVDTPKVTPKKVETSKATPKKVDTLKATPKKVGTPKKVTQLGRLKLVPKKAGVKATTINTPKSTSSRGQKRKASLTPQAAAKSKKKTKVAVATPKQGSTPKKTPKKVQARVLGRTPGKTPGKTPKKSWADVLKRGLMARKMPSSKAQRAREVIQKARVLRDSRKAGGVKSASNTKFSLEVPQSFDFRTSTTGHVNSPAPIFIYKKTAKTPRVFRKGRKSPLKSRTTGPAGTDEHLEGLAGLMDTPGKVVDSEARMAHNIKTIESIPRVSLNHLSTPEGSPRPRGRPPKQATSPSKTPEGSPRPRGRPPKQTASPAKTPEGTPRPRGRPPTNTASPVKTLEGSPRPRGRPPTKAASPAKTPEGTPRPRGRPPTQVASLTKKTPEGTPRPRGRPPKKDSTPSPVKMPQNISGSTEQIEALSPGKNTLDLKSPVLVSIASPVKTPEETTPKRKGRPPKYSMTPNLKTPSGPSASDFEDSLGASPALFSPYTPSIVSNSHTSVKMSMSYANTPSSYGNITNFDFSSIKTPDVTEDKFISPLVTPAVANNTPERLLRSVRGKSALASPEEVPIETDATTFDFECADTPNVSQDIFVSPVGVKSELRGLKSLYKKNNAADYKNVEGLEKLMSTPKPDNVTSSSCTAVSGLRNLMKTPKMPVPEKETDDTHLAGMRKILRTPKPVSESPQADYSNVAGVCKLMKTPAPSVAEREADDSHIVGVRKVLRTPKPNPESPKADFTSVTGLRKLMKTPKANVTEEPVDDSKLFGIGKMLRTPRTTECPEADYTNIHGVHKLMKTPKGPVPEREPDYTHIAGVRKVLRTPKPTPPSPKADYNNISGVKNLLKTPREETLNEADYTNVTGLKRLLRNPRSAKEAAEADYTNVQGLRDLMKSPRQKPENVEIEADYTEPKGLRNLMATPAQKRLEPLADYTNVKGMKRLLSTPQTHINIPEADYTSVHGVKNIMRTPKSQDYSLEVDLQGLGQLMKTPLTDQTNVVSQVTELRQTTTPASVRKSRRAPKVISPTTSSPSENIPPVEPLKSHTEVVQEKELDEGLTPRRTRRTIKTESESNTPVRRGRSRQVNVKNEVAQEDSPVSSTRSRRGKRGTAPEEVAEVPQKKSKRRQNQADESVDSNEGSEETIVELPVPCNINEKESEDIVEEKKSLPRRGGRSRKDAALQSEVTTNEETEVAKVLTPVKRRQKQSEDMEVNLPVAVETAIDEPVKPSTPAKRGQRKAQPKKEEETDDSSLDIPAVKRTRGKSTKEVAKVEESPKVSTPVRRGRRRGQVEIEKETEPQELPETPKVDEVQMSVDEDLEKPVKSRGKRVRVVEPKEVNTEEVKPTTRRGRSQKVVEELDTEGEKMVNSKPKGGRRAVSKQETSEANEELVKTVSSGRGRGKKKTDEAEKDSNQETELPTPVKRRGRAAKAIEEPEPTSDASTPTTTRRGRGKATNSKEEEESESSQDQVKTTSRGRGRKQTTKDTEETIVAEPETKTRKTRGKKVEPAKNEEEVAQTSTKSRRKVDTEEKVTKVTRQTRSRK